ncbi:type II toxin-antitoxin system VapC family toxin [Bosea sp. PAMC 26642]|uniref:type II toxin-antitoxin system VapC family toxin n=1 Tax=Bosea sp. (strain PAMC 26642) TaxID=1792307 RepID=UPI0007704C5F|nr:type II toxin-antitoxin system VapC family toxin [Bosea sp. PAMC 26642]AMJ60422.1 twitching motility protein PilT [Bosea sp. PAMC 26642]
MKGFLLDTNILSDLRKPRPHPGVLTFVGGLPGRVLHVSAVTFAEIRYGIERLGDAERCAGLFRWLDEELRPQFGGRVVDVSEDVLVLWRRLIEHGRKRGHTFSQPDVLIAASAEANDLIVVSRDISEFVEAGVPVLNPWDNSYVDRSGTMRPVARPDTMALLD